VSTGGEVEVVDGELLPECGQRGCSTVARPGSALCDAHAVGQMIAAAKRKLVMAAPMAAEQLIALSETAPSEEVRRKAAADILDRAGVRGGVEVDVVVGQAGVDPATLLRERLAQLRRRTSEGVATEQAAFEQIRDGA